MILTAHQPCYLPWAGHFAKIAQADKFVIFDGVPFSRHDYTNRVQIKTHQGVQWLTVPVEHGQPLLKDARIVQGNWPRKHLRAIELAYFKAPYFKLYFAPLKMILESRFEKLVDLDETLLLYLFACLGIDVPIERASDYEFQGEKSALVLDMCRQLGATRYIFGQQGKNYADAPAFQAAGIEIEFQDYRHPVYPQLHGEFVAGLSVIDLLFNCGPDSLGILTSHD